MTGIPNVSGTNVLPDGGSSVDQLGSSTNSRKPKEPTPKPPGKFKTWLGNLKGLLLVKTIQTHRNHQIFNAMEAPYHAVAEVQSIKQQSKNEPKR